LATNAQACHMAAEMGKLGQIRDTKPKQDKWASRKNWDFFWGTSLKIETVPENPEHMVTLYLLPQGAYSKHIVAEIDRQWLSQSLYHQELLSLQLNPL